MCFSSDCAIHEYEWSHKKGWVTKQRTANVQVLRTVEVVQARQPHFTLPLVHCPYLRRLEYLTIYRCHCKGSMFSSVILRPWVLVRSGTWTRDLTGRWLHFEPIIAFKANYYYIWAIYCIWGQLLLHLEPVITFAANYHACGLNTGECFHIFFKFSQSFMSVSIRQ